MSTSVGIRLINGLGDKMLDLIGMYIICKYLSYRPYAQFFNDGHFAWGHNTYDLRLFDMSDDISISDPTTALPYYAFSPDPSSSVCPYRVYHFLRQYIPTISFEQISEDFSRHARQIVRPSDIILRDIPEDIVGAYGIHLRKSDKLTEWGNVQHENTTPEFETIIGKLLEDVRQIISEDADPKFLIVSEDEVWKEEIREKIREIAIELGKDARFVYPNYSNAGEYSNFRSIMDMFCLSKCKEILQGVKFSTFSILAALIGNRKLRNYSRYLASDNMCLIYIWNSVLEINGMKNLDIETHARITSNIKWLDTNISGFV